VTGPEALDTHAAIAEILSLNRLLALSTVSPDGRAHANTAFFAFDDDLSIYLLSPPASEHARNLISNPSAAVAVYDSRQTKESRRGVQLFGRMSEVAGPEGDRALRCFGARFDDISAAASTYDEVLVRFEWRFFKLVPERAKVFDEVLLLHGDYVEVDLN
jgi:uncharacterized protein YhbP (UPF0306 family)